MGIPRDQLQKIMQGYSKRPATENNAGILVFGGYSVLANSCRLARSWLL